MSSSVQYSFHTAADPNGLGLAAGSVPAEPAPEPKRATPIIVAASDVQAAFDLFQPEPPAGRAAPPPALPLVSLTPGGALAEFSHGQFPRPAARGLAPQPVAMPAPDTAGPSAAEVASARALTIAWLTAVLIAIFAFLSQGPTISSRTADDAVKPAAATDAPGAPAALRPGDIRLDAPADKPAAPAKVRRPVVKPPAPPPETPPPQP